MITSDPMRVLPIAVLALLGVSSGHAATTDFYIVDVGHGNAAFVVSPSGETMLLDAGPAPAAARLVAFMEQNGIKKVDYLVVSHFEDDHMGAAPAMSEKVPILNWVDHGDSVTYGKDDEWWKRHRAPWFRENMSKMDDARYDKFRAARAKGNHIVVKPGDRIPVKGVDAIVLSGLGKVISGPLKAKGAGAPNPACSAVETRSEDDAEDGQSVGVVIGAGKFRFIYLGDMTWNTSKSLFCPNNLVGTVDAYLITHHAQAMPKEMGDYYYGLSCCSTAEVRGLHPRVAILSMGAQGHKQGTSAAIEVVESSPGLEGVWQTEKIVAGGEAGHNAPDDQIANIGGPRSEKVPFIKLSAEADGWFSVTNSRNGLTKNYPAK
jgi:competence protein ComEC